MANMTNILNMAAKLGLHNLAKKEFLLPEEDIPNADFLEFIFSKELELREVKRKEKARFYSRLPSGFTLDDYNLDFNSGISKWQLDTLLTFSWIEERYNLIILAEQEAAKLISLPVSD